MFAPFTRGTRGGLFETARIVWPLALALSAQAVNGICDRFFLAQHSNAALAAVLPAEMLAATLTQFLAATIGYSATFVAQFHGGGQGHKAVSAFAQGLWLTLFALPLFLAAVPLARLVLGCAGHAADVAAAENTYFTIAAPGGALIVLNTVLVGMLAGQGKTRPVGLCFLVGSILNLVLDPLLILVADLGIIGAAVSSILAHLTTTAMLACFLLRDPLVRTGLRTGSFRFSSGICTDILRFGLPVGAISLASLVSFCVFNLAAGRCHPLELAASNTVFAVNNIFFLSCTAVAQGVTILTGRYHGAADDDAAVRSLRSGLVLVGGALVLCFAVCLSFSDLIMRAFYNAQSSYELTDFQRCGMILFAIMFFREIAEGVATTVSGALRGIGDTSHVMRLQCAVDLGVRLPLVLLVAALTNSIYWLWLVMPLDMGLSAILLFTRWRSNRWKQIRLDNQA